MSTLSIIGSGGMAAAIGARAAKAGHTVEVVSRDPAKARALAEKLPSGAIAGTYGAVPARNELSAGRTRPHARLGITSDKMLSATRHVSDLR